MAKMTLEQLRKLRDERKQDLSRRETEGKLGRIAQSVY